MVDSGVRAAVSDGDDRRARPGRRARGCAPQVLESLDRIAEAGPRVTPSLGPHAIYTVSAESLAWLAEVAAEREIPLQIHLSETEQEVADCLEAHGKRPAAYLDELGFLGERTRARSRRLARRGRARADRRARGHGRRQPRRQHEARGRRRAAPIPPRRAAGRRRSGSAPTASPPTPTSTLFEEVKLFALSQKHASGDPATLPAAEALAIARGLRSPVLGGTRARGRRSPPTSCCSAARTPSSRPAISDADLVYAAGGAVVDTTVVAGRVLMRDREVARPPRRSSPRSAREPSASPDSVIGPPCAPQARFPDVPEKAGHYESFYLKLVQPGGGQGAWIRHTVHKRPGEERDLRDLVRPLRLPTPRGRGRPSASSAPTSSRAGPDTYIRVADATLTDGRATGRVATDVLEASWDLSFADEHEPFHHLPRDFLYRSQAPEDEVPQPLPGRGLQRAARGGRRADRGRRLARDDRPQLGRRARRALGLDPGLGLRGPLARGLLRHGGRPDQGRRQNDAVGRQRDADARRPGPPARRLRPCAEHRGRTSGPPAPASS